MKAESKKQTMRLLEMTLEIRDYLKMYPGITTEHVMDMPIGSKTIANTHETYFDIQVVKSQSGYIAYWRRNNTKS